MEAFFKDFFDNFKTYSAVASGLAFSICIIIGLLATSGLFAAFGIDFFAKAELGDYIILGVRKVTSSLEAFVVAALIVITINAIFSIFDAYKSQTILSLKGNDIGIIEAKFSSLMDQFRIFDNSIARIVIFVLVSTLLVVSNTSTLDSKAIKFAEVGIKSVKYGKNETELKCVIFIGDTGSFSHYWSITDKSVKSVNTSSIQIIETMFDAAKKPYLTFTSDKPKPERQFGMTSQPPRYPLTSPFYDKWRNENEERTTSIARACTKS